MILEVFRKGGPLKLTAWGSLFFFSFTFYSPAALALKQEVEQGTERYQSTAKQPLVAALDEALAQLRSSLQQAQENLEQQDKELAQASFFERATAWVTGTPTSVVPEVDDIKSRLADLKQRHKEEQEQRHEHLKDHNLSSEILARETAQQARENARWNALELGIARIEAANSGGEQSAAIDALEQLLALKAPPRHKPFDPDRMPFGIAKSEAREPVDNVEQLRRVSPDFQPASANPYSTHVLSSEENALADLAETLEVRFTPEIFALAAELDNNPVKIYNWVHDNIEYLPTYGSIQGAQLTLNNKKGNAFDTASLLIALLRASNIPARYVYGTVRIPADKVMNWVGDVHKPEAAQQLLGQGGVPNIGELDGGQIKYIKMEHVWVEAYADFEPGRGAMHEVGDTWVPMDASFKQYSYTDGMDLQTEVPFDAETFASQIIDGAVINEQEGWVQGVDQALIQQRMNQYRSDVEAFIDAQDPDTTVGDVLGTRKAILREMNTLDSGLPYALVATLWRDNALPDHLRYKFAYIFSDEYGNESARFEKNAAELAGKRLAVSFRPATEEDAQLIASYLPEPPADGGELDPSDLPDTLPGYLINLTAEITLDGELIETGPTVTMGTELNARLGYKFPNQNWDLRPKTLIAGEYQAVGLDLAGIAQRQLEDIKTELEHVQTQLENNTAEGLTRHSLTGNLLQTGVLSYFALNDVQDQLAAQQAGIVTNRMPSFGTFATTVKTYYWWGIPRDVSFPGVTMDIDYLYSQVVDKENEQQDVVNFGRATGPRMSALEHLVPEQLFSTEENPAEGISAVKAIALAQAEGQRVYTLNSGNLDAALAAITATPEIESEIRNAVYAGKEVTIHQSEINHYGWSGHGYIIFDPETGAGAYKIGGGLDGGELALDALGVLVSLLTLIKDAIVSLLDNFRLSFVDALYSIYQNAIILSSECSGWLFAAAISMIALLTISALFVFALFPIVFAFIAGILLTYALNGLVGSWVSYCSRN